MEEQIETSGWDETLARSFYSSRAEAVVSQWPVYTVDFEYTVQADSLLDQVKAKFGESLTYDLPAGHLAIVENSEQRPNEDLEFIERTCETQRQALIE